VECIRLHPARDESIARRLSSPVPAGLCVGLAYRLLFGVESSKNKKNREEEGLGWVEREGGRGALLLLLYYYCYYCYYLSTE